MDKVLELGIVDDLLKTVGQPMYKLLETHYTLSREIVDKYTHWVDWSRVEIGPYDEPFMRRHWGVGEAYFRDNNTLSHAFLVSVGIGGLEAIEALVTEVEGTFLEPDFVAIIKGNTDLPLDLITRICYTDRDERRFIDDDIAIALLETHQVPESFIKDHMLKDGYTDWGDTIYTDEEVIEAILIHYDTLSEDLLFTIVHFGDPDETQKLNRKKLICMHQSKITQSFALYCLLEEPWSYQKIKHWSTTQKQHIHVTLKYTKAYQPIDFADIDVFLTIDTRPVVAFVFDVSKHSTFVNGPPLIWQLKGVSECGKYTLCIEHSADALSTLGSISRHSYTYEYVCKVNLFVSRLKLAYIEYDRVIVVTINT